VLGPARPPEPRKSACKAPRTRAQGGHELQPAFMSQNDHSCTPCASIAGGSCGRALFSLPLTRRSNNACTMGYDEDPLPLEEVTKRAYRVDIVQLLPYRSSSRP